MIWINGPFGGGKTTTARALVERRDDLRIFDPEHVGYLLLSNLRGITIDDFQDLPAWRDLVPVVARHLTDISGQRLVAVQTVLNPGYWKELKSGLDGHGLDVFHVLLDIDRSALEKRIADDQDEVEARGWRLQHVEAFLDARSRLAAEADLVIDTTQRSPDAVAAAIATALP